MAAPTVTPSAATGLSEPLPGRDVTTPTRDAPGAPPEHCSASVAGIPSVTEVASETEVNEEDTAVGAAPVRDMVEGAGEGNQGVPTAERSSKRHLAMRPPASATAR